MSDIAQCYLVGLVSGLLLGLIPAIAIWHLYQRERARGFWSRWWLRHQQQFRRERE